MQYSLIVKIIQDLLGRSNNIIYKVDKIIKKIISTSLNIIWQHLEFDNKITFLRLLNKQYVYCKWAKSKKLFLG